MLLNNTHFATFAIKSFSTTDMDYPCWNFFEVLIGDKGQKLFWQELSKIVFGLLKL